MLSICRGYRGTTRYKALAEGCLTYLALHEYACAEAELPTDQLPIVTGTEWSKKIKGGVEHSIEVSSSFYMGQGAFPTSIAIIS